MSNRFDIHYGRQGGRIVDFDEAFSVDDFPRCSACGQPMVVGQRGRHFLCDPASIVGRSCSCPPQCTDTHVGDRGVCDPACLSCATLHGRPYAEVEAWQTNRKPVVQADPDDEPTELVAQLSIFGGAA